MTDFPPLCFSQQVEASGYAIVGERVPLAFVVAAGGALSGASLTVTAVYREGIGGPQLFVAPPTGVNFCVNFSVCFLPPCSILAGFCCYMLNFHSISSFRCRPSLT